MPNMSPSTGNAIGSAVLLSRDSLTGLSMKATHFDRRRRRRSVQSSTRSFSAIPWKKSFMNKLSECVSWPVLIVGAIVTTVLSLSVHAVMLQGLHVPYPYNFPHTGWARLPDGILSAFGVIYLFTHLPQGIRKQSFALRCALVFFSSRPFMRLSSATHSWSSSISATSRSTPFSTTYQS